MLGRRRRRRRRRKRKRKRARTITRTSTKSKRRFRTSEKENKKRRWSWGNVLAVPHQPRDVLQGVLEVGLLGVSEELLLQLSTVGSCHQQICLSYQHIHCPPHHRTLRYQHRHYQYHHHHLHHPYSYQSCSCSTRWAVPGCTSRSGSQ